MDQKKNEQRKGHPIICPKCKYNRPIALSYCPHCRELDKAESLKEIMNKKDLKLVDANTLPSNNTNNDRPSTKRENTQQKKQQSTNGEIHSKLQSVPRARKRATKKPSLSNYATKIK